MVRSCDECKKWALFIEINTPYALFLLFLGSDDYTGFEDGEEKIKIGKVEIEFE